MQRDAARADITRRGARIFVAPATRYRIARMHTEFAAVARRIQWHLARHAQWGDTYWMHPAIRDEVDYEKYACGVKNQYWHWCGDRDAHDPPTFPFGLTCDW